MMAASESARVQAVSKNKFGEKRRSEKIMMAHGDYFLGLFLFCWNIESWLT
jgi:hypothetical protein